MQSAKDTFYVAIRDRLAQLNPERTLAVRGVVRPGVIVEENELVVAPVPVDAFRLRWGNLTVQTQGPAQLIAMTCEISYATDGTTGNSGLDRGRMLAVMDAELAAIVGTEPKRLPKLSYTTMPPVPMATNVFWGELTFGALNSTGERLSRVATVEVFSYGEAGEL